MGCGTWSWGNRFLWSYDSAEQDKELQKTYNYMVNERGLNWFDTADSYGTQDLNGRSEELLGIFNTENTKKKKEVYFCTKLAPYPWRIGASSMLKAADESIARLGKGKIDMVQLHWPPTYGWQEKEYIQAFSSLVKSGLTRQIGVSNYGPKKLRYISKLAQECGCEIVSNQVQLSLLSRYPLEGYPASSMISGFDNSMGKNNKKETLAEVCTDLNIQLIGYSPLGLGLLTDKYYIDGKDSYLPSGFRSLLFKEYLPVMQELLQILREIATLRKKTVAQVVLNWNLQYSLVLVGMRSVQQAKDNLNAFGWSLTTAERDSITAAAKKVPKQLVQNSFQTQ